ncbi:MAG TPA: four helix bundle protein [Gemmatimonadaceae bacterium]|nr:four helix bundle protein [Gemmatimonadaceae bacterium]
MTSRGYRDLVVWQQAMDLVVISHRIADSLPATQRFALADQIRRAAISIPANIAEGYTRIHRGDYLRHLSIARASAGELDTHLLIAVRLGYGEPDLRDRALALTDRVSRLLVGLTRSLGGRKTGA